MSNQIDTPANDSSHNTTQQPMDGSAKVYIRGGGKVKEMTLDQLRRPHTVIHANRNPAQRNDNAGGLLQNGGHRPEGST